MNIRVTATPHPAWCSPEHCFGSSIDGEGAHVSAPVVLVGRQEFPRVEVEVGIYRVDSALYGKPWISMSTAQGVNALLTTLDAYRLAALLIDLANQADASERAANRLNEGDAR